MRNDTWPNKNCHANVEKLLVLLPIINFYKVRASKEGEKHTRFWECVSP